MALQPTIAEEKPLTNHRIDNVIVLYHTEMLSASSKGGGGCGTGCIIGIILGILGVIGIAIIVAVVAYVASGNLGKVDKSKSGDSRGGRGGGEDGEDGIVKVAEEKF